MKDSYGDWHPCAVTEVVFDDSYEGVKVKYTSWAKRPTEWVDDAAKVRVWFTCILPLYIQRCIYTVYTRIYSPCFPDTCISPNHSSGDPSPPSQCAVVGHQWQLPGRKRHDHHTPWS